jgi:hypothetical protein
MHHISRSIFLVAASIANIATTVYYGTRLLECMGSYSILPNAIVRYMYDGLWYGITVQLIQTIPTTVVPSTTAYSLVDRINNYADRLRLIYSINMAA